MNEISAIKVRAAKSADEKGVLALAQAEMEEHVRMDVRFRLRDDAFSRYAVYLRDRMRDIDSSVFVAEDGERIVGLAIGTVRKTDSFFQAQRFGYVSDLMVSPGMRRRGVGRALYERTALWFRSLGIDVVRLHVAVESGEARAFWRSIGARDFLVEAWIDLPAAVAPESDSPAAAEPRETDDVLTGPEGSR